MRAYILQGDKVINIIEIDPTTTTVTETEYKAVSKSKVKSSNLYVTSDDKKIIMGDNPLLDSAFDNK